MSQSQSQSQGDSFRPEPTSFLNVYAPPAGSYDELFVGPGELRAHTQRFADGLSRLGVESVNRHWDRAQRQIRENGVTYNLHGHVDGLDRPWQLDPLPLLITNDEWHSIERALCQRAHVLDLVLQDMYGAQSLLRQGLIPPELMFANPGFLRACVQRTHAPRRFLHLYAADVVRGPAGDFWILADRTQAPSGMGYALENRVVLSRALPNLYRDCVVHRLAPFFSTLLDTLRRMSPRRIEQPHVVLLTSGSYNETYFEHAYLARYLGITLVEGADLTVRDRTVYLKTLGGLQRVDVILRRMDDAFCDPLSLRSDSVLGVAGLISAVRAGNVAIANALGSGAVQCHGLLPFLPALCQHLLGEELKLPSAATYWCGQASALSHVEANVDKLLFKGAFSGVGPADPISGATLSRAEKADLLDKIRARPFDYVAQEPLELSTAPVWQGGALSPRKVTLRSFLISDGPGYRAMQGGLARVARDRQTLVTLQRGAGSKDVWVLAEGPISQLTLLPARPVRVELSRSGNDLPSRVADNLFWMGRYVERAEGATRLMRAILLRLTEDIAPSDVPELPMLVRAFGVLTETPAPAGYRGDEPDLGVLETYVMGQLTHPEAPHSLLNSIGGAQRAATAVRDRISGDTWRVLSQLMEDHDLLRENTTLGIGEALDCTNRLVVSFAALSGLQHESLTRTFGYRFAEMGRRLERARCTALLLRSCFTVAHPEEAALQTAILEVLDNIITYRRRYQGAIQLAPVLDLLLTDETNPRSVAFQLTEVETHIRELPRARNLPSRSEEERMLIRALTRVRLAEIEKLCVTAVDGTRPGLEKHLQALLEELPALSDTLSRGYLSHSVPMQALGVEATVNEDR
jgi:uncharacterized circularly permuted ATP-grasp superfamily protein/uncharacterized alpha-E superfamily protein